MQKYILLSFFGALPATKTRNSAIPSLCCSQKCFFSIFGTQLAAKILGIYRLAEFFKGKSAFD